MKHEPSDDEPPNFIPYDDENLEHVLAGPDYGQPESSSHAWTELDSKEYPDYVLEVASKIIRHPIKIVA